MQILRFKNIPVNSRIKFAQHDEIIDITKDDDWNDDNEIVREVTIAQLLKSKNHSYNNLHVSFCSNFSKTRTFTEISFYQSIRKVLHFNNRSSKFSIYAYCQ